MIQSTSVDPGLLASAQSVRGDAQKRGMDRFSSVLEDEILNGDPGAPRASAEERARRAAESFVSLALIQPVLKQLRETNMAEAPFAPGEVEKQFGPLLDAEISRRITRASNFGLVDRVAELLLERGGESVAKGVVA